MAAAAAPRTPATLRLPQISTRCTGCGRCVAACAPHVLWLEPAPGFTKTAVLHAPAQCTGCSDCAVVCPVHAIRMRPAPG